MPFLLAVVHWLRRNWSWLKWPVAAALIGALIYQNRVEISRVREREIDWTFAAIAFVLSFVAIVLTIVRWFLLVRAQGFDFRFVDALRLGFIGYSCTYFMPSSVGGDVVKGVLIARQQKERRVTAAATVVVDRAVGMVALFMVGAFASLFLNRTMLEHGVIRAVVAVLWTGALGGLIGMAVLLHPAVPRSRWLNRLIHLRFVGPAIGGSINSLLLYQRHRMAVAAALGISIVSHFAMLSSFYFCMRTLNASDTSPGYWTHLMLIPGAEMAGALIPTPGGLGALEGAVVKAYKLANEANGSPVEDGAAGASGLLASAIFRVINVLIVMLGGVFYIGSRRAIQEALEDQREPHVPCDG